MLLYEKTIYNNVMSPCRQRKHVLSMTRKAISSPPNMGKPLQCGTEHYRPEAMQALQCLP